MPHSVVVLLAMKCNLERPMQHSVAALVAMKYRLTKPMFLSVAGLQIVEQNNNISHHV